MAIYAYKPFTDEDEAVIRNMEDEVGGSTLEDAQGLYALFAARSLKGASSYIDDYGFIHRLIDNRNDSLYMYLFEMDGDDVTAPLKVIREIMVDCPFISITEQLGKLETMLEEHEFEIE